MDAYEKLSQCLTDDNSLSCLKMTGFSEQQSVVQRARK